MTKKVSYKIFNVPLLSLSFIAAFLVGKILIRSELPFFVAIGWISMVGGFFLCLFIVFSCFYYLHKIATAKCYFCNKELEGKGKKAAEFMLTAPWKKRKVELICHKCKKGS